MASYSPTLRQYEFQSSVPGISLRWGNRIWTLAELLLILASQRYIDWAGAVWSSVEVAMGHGVRPLLLLTAVDPFTSTVTWIEIP